AIGGLGHHLKALAFQHRLQGVPDEAVVVGEENLERHSHSSNGTVTDSRVPAPGAEATSSVPPRRSARSRVLVSPSPGGPLWTIVAPVLKPTPSSVTEQSIARDSR